MVQSAEMSPHLVHDFVGSSTYLPPIGPSAAHVTGLYQLRHMELDMTAQLLI